MSIVYWKAETEKDRYLKTHRGMPAGVHLYSDIPITDHQSEAVVKLWRAYAYLKEQWTRAHVLPYGKKWTGAYCGFPTEQTTFGHERRGNVWHDSKDP